MKYKRLRLVLVTTLLRVERDKISNYLDNFKRINHYIRKIVKATIQLILYSKNMFDTYIK